jgi:hypothetical protein
VAFDDTKLAKKAVERSSRPSGNEIRSLRRFVECPVVKKPGKKATVEARAEYRKAVKTHNLSQQGLEIIKGLTVWENGRER